MQVYEIGEVIKIDSCIEGWLLGELQSLVLYILSMLELWGGVHFHDENMMCCLHCQSQAHVHVGPLCYDLLEVEIRGDGRFVLSRELGSMLEEFTVKSKFRGLTSSLTIQYY